MLFEHDVIREVDRDLLRTFAGEAMAMGVFNIRRTFGSKKRSVAYAHAHGLKTPPHKRPAGTKAP